MSKISYRAKDGSLFDADDCKANVAFFKDSDGLERKFWRTNKANIDFTIAPTVESMREQIDIFFSEQKCACCFFVFSLDEINWMNRKLSNGLLLIEALKKIQSNRAQELFKTFEMSSSQNPFLSKQLGHKISPPNILPELFYTGVKDDQKIELFRNGKAVVQIKDPLRWEISVTSEESPLQSNMFWREEYGNPCYITALNVDSLLQQTKHVYQDESMSYGFTPLQISYLLILLETIDRISVNLGEHEEQLKELVKAWSNCDIYPLDLV